MEHFAGEAVMYRYRHLYSCKAQLAFVIRSVHSTTHPPHSLSISTILGMGRHSWATADQLEYLRSRVPQLSRAKKTTGLQTFYQQVHEDFLTKWQPDPVVPVAGMSPEQAVAKAKERLLNVGIELSYCFIPLTVL